MQTSQTQNIGAATILLASLIIYGSALLSVDNPRAEPFLPWGNQGPATKAVEVSGSRGSDGIYFFPASLTLGEILKLLEIAGDGDGNPSREAILTGFACTVSVDGGTVNIKRMPAVKHLALGLPLDLNRASPEELALVPGIDARLAELIVQRRQIGGRFESLADLKVVRGIKERKVQALKDYLLVEPPQ